MPSAPSYSAARAMLLVLEEKGHEQIPAPAFGGNPSLGMDRGLAAIVALPFLGSAF